jgi:hypothetical protein
MRTSGFGTNRPKAGIEIMGNSISVAGDSADRTIDAGRVECERGVSVLVSATVIGGDFAAIMYQNCVQQCIPSTSDTVAVIIIDKSD